MDSGMDRSRAKTICQICAATEYETMSEFVRKTLHLLRQEKKWWLIPLLVAAGPIALLVYLTQTPEPLSPFMYSR
jgi:hypothetical protein